MNARRLASRCSGTVVSLVIHGGLVLAAVLCAAAPRYGRGGGIAGTPEVGSGTVTYTGHLREEPVVDFDSREPDARAFAEPSAEQEPVEPVPVPPQDFLNEPAETGVPVAKPATPPSESTPHARAKEAFSKLPPTGAQAGSEEKGNSAVNGTGGDSGVAGDGTAGALYMPAPVYPASARRKGVEGVVVVAVEVCADGHCENARLAESSGNDALDDAALAAVKKWRYEARPGEAPELRRVRFVFRLT